MPEKEYERLTFARPRARFAVLSAGNSSLWLGKDHVLGIDTNGYTETYKRFYFRDIQAVVIQKTDRQKWWGLISAILAAAFLVPAALSGELALKWVLGIIGGLFGLVFVINLILGPTSTCQLQTAVQVEDLPSMNRLRRARAVLDRVRPLVVAAQGTIAPEVIPARLQEIRAPGTAASAQTENPPASVVGAEDVPPQNL